jgi:hypothetical protein
MDDRMQVEWGEFMTITRWCGGNVNFSDAIGKPRLYVQIPVDGVKYAASGRAYMGDWIVKSTDGQFHVERQSRIKEG